MNVDKIIGEADGKARDMLSMQGKTTARKGFDVQATLGLGMGGKKSGKAQAVLDKFLGPPSNKNPVESILGMTTKSNIVPPSVFGVESRARQHMVRRPDMIGWKRLNQQKGLNPMGDFDGDKVLNAFDCNPRNPNQQAFWHTMWEGVKGGAENIGSAAKSVVSPELPPPGEVGFVSRAVLGTQQPMPAAEELEQKTGEPLVMLPQPREVPLSLLEKQEITARELEKERLKGLSAIEVERIKAQKEAAIAEQKQYGESVLGVGKTAKATRKVLTALTAGGAFTQAPTQEQQSIMQSQKVSSLVGFGGPGTTSGLGVYEAVRTGQTHTYPTKVAELVGTPASRAAPMQMEVAAAPPMPQQAPTGPTPTGQTYPGIEVFSPYTKKKVSYVRGPYRKQPRRER